VVVVDGLVVVGVLDEGVLVDVVVVGVVDVSDGPLEDDGAEDDVDELELGLEVLLELELEVLLELVLVVEVPVVDEPDPLAGLDEDEVFEDLGGFATSPLWFRVVSTSCWTVATWEATTAGVPPAPRAGRAFSCFSACSSLASSARDGCEFSVITIWSAIAVVVQAGQS
jgi:hypothetical protein